MIDEKLWPKLLKNNIYQVNISSFNKKKFSVFQRRELLIGKKRY